MFHYFKTPYIICTIFLQYIYIYTMNILDPILYRMLFLQFPPMTSLCLGRTNSLRHGGMEVGDQTNQD